MKSYWIKKEARMKTRLAGLDLALVMFAPGSLWAESLLENTEATAAGSAVPN